MGERNKTVKKKRTKQNSKKELFRSTPLSVFTFHSMRLCFCALSSFWF